jgi:hypothetical protein
MGLEYGRNGSLSESPTFYVYQSHEDWRRSGRPEIMVSTPGLVLGPYVRRMSLS